MYWEYFRWAKDVAFSPAKNTKKDYKYSEFVKRLVVVSLVSGVLTTLITLITFASALGNNDPIVLASAFVSIPIFIITAILGPFVGAAIVHFFGKIVFKLMKKEYKKTYNADAYSTVPNFLFGWIPVVGGVIGGIWGLIVYVYALSNQQGISKGRALLVIFIPIVVVFLIMAALLLVSIDLFSQLSALPEIAQ